MSNLLSAGAGEKQCGQKTMEAPWAPSLCCHDRGKAQECPNYLLFLRNQIYGFLWDTNCCEVCFLPVEWHTKVPSMGFQQPAGCGLNWCLNYSHFNCWEWFSVIMCFLIMQISLLLLFVPMESTAFQYEAILGTNIVLFSYSLWQK